MTDGRAGTRRVLHANMDFGVTTETFIRDRMLELDRLGWQAWVATRSVRNRESCPFPPDDRVFATPKPPRVRRAIDRALRVPYPMRSSFSWLQRPMREVRPDLVHAHFGWVAVAVQPVAEQHGIPLLPSFHGFDVTVWPRQGFGGKRLRKNPYEELFARVPRVLAVSHFIAGRLRELGYDGEIVVVPSGTRLELFPFRGPRTLDSSPRLLYVGRIIPYKGVDVLLRALPSVLREAPGVRLDVVGDGEDRAMNEALARTLGLSDHVTFHGAVAHDAVARAMQAADVLVMPSRTGEDGRVEGLGNVSKEALATGLEVVLTDSGGMPEAMPPDRRDELVREGDPRALADGILHVLDQRCRWQERADRSRAWIEGAFDWRKLAPRIAAVYDRVVRGADIEDLTWTRPASP